MFSGWCDAVFWGPALCVPGKPLFWKGLTFSGNVVLIWGGSNSEKPNPLQIRLHSLRHSTALPLCDKFTCSQLGLDFNCKLWSIPQANMIPSSHCFVIGATGCPFSPNPPCLNPLSPSTPSRPLSLSSSVSSKAIPPSAGTARVVATCSLTSRATSDRRGR